MNAEGQHSKIEHHDSKSAKSESHDSSCTESGVETISPSRLLSANGSSYVREHSNLHSEVSRNHGGNCSKDKGEGCEESTNSVSSSI